jgi:hypothetical protein
MDGLSCKSLLIKGRPQEIALFVSGNITRFEPSKQIVVTVLFYVIYLDWDILP